MRSGGRPPCEGKRSPRRVIIHSQYKEEAHGPEIINLYDRFTHGGMNRRDFLDRLIELAGSAAAAAALLPLLQNDYAQAAIVAGDDPRLATERSRLQFAQRQDQRLSRARQGQGQAPGRAGHSREPRAQPAYRGRGAPVRGRGLSRLCGRSLSLVGGTPRERGRGARAARQDEPGRRGHALVAAVSFLKTHAESTGKVGAVGFCFGG